jgi:hypothetical protein
MMAEYRAGRKLPLYIVGWRGHWSQATGWWFLGALELKISRRSACGHSNKFRDEIIAAVKEIAPHGVTQGVVLSPLLENSRVDDVERESGLACARPILLECRSLFRSRSLLVGLILRSGRNPCDNEHQRNKEHAHSKLLRDSIALNTGTKGGISPDAMTAVEPLTTLDHHIQIDVFMYSA